MSNERSFPKHLPIYEVQVNGITAEWDTDKSKCDKVYADAVGVVKMYRLNQNTGKKMLMSERRI